jgi:hypothetical protein
MFKKVNLLLLLVSVSFISCEKEERKEENELIEECLDNCEEESGEEAAGEEAAGEVVAGEVVAGEEAAGEVVAGEEQDADLPEEDCSSDSQELDQGVEESCTPDDQDSSDDTEI